MNKIKVNLNDVGRRIDSYIAGNTELSRTNIQRLIEEGKILVNFKNTKVSYKVQENDQITIEEEKPKETSLKAQNIPI